MELTFLSRPCFNELDVFLDNERVGHLICSNRTLVLFVPINGKAKCYDTPVDMLRDLTGGHINGKIKKT